jgi:hypothetical protein
MANLNTELERRLEQGVSYSSQNKPLKGKLKSRVDIRQAQKTKQVKVTPPPAARPVIKSKVKIKSKKRVKQVKNPKTVEILPITNLLNVPEGWEQEFLEAVTRQQRDISHFILTNLVSMEIALPAALEDTLDCIRMITGEDAPGFDLGAVRPAFQKMLDAKLILFLADSLKLPNEVSSLLVEGLVGVNNDSKQKLKDYIKQLILTKQDSKKPTTNSRRPVDTRKSKL